MSQKPQKLLYKPKKQNQTKLPPPKDKTEKNTTYPKEKSKNIELFNNQIQNFNGQIYQGSEVAEY